MANRNALKKQITGYGVDRQPENRPGVPMEVVPSQKAAAPSRQTPTVKVFKRVGLEKLTPVFGTCQPPRGISGAIRGAAYQIAEDKAGHWALLLFADRVDVLEGRARDAFTRKPYVGLWAIAAGIGLSFLQNKTKTGRTQNGT